MSARRGRQHWAPLDMAASLAISAFWHLLVLAVLAMAVTPFKLPDQSQPITVELLPPLTPPPPVDVTLAPRPVETPPPVAPTPLEVQPKPAQEKPPAVTPPLEVARLSQPVLDSPLDVARRQTAVKRLQANAAAPQIPEAPPAPLDLARPAAPALQTPIEVRRTALAPPKPLDATRAAPAIPQPAAPSEAITTQLAQAPPDTGAAPAPAQIQVLTNENLVKAPAEIRPRDHTPISPRVTAQTAPDIPAGAAAGGGQPPAGSSTPGGGAAGGGRTGDGRVIGGFDAPALKGLRTTLGCASPDTYRLTSQERALCLQRLAKQAQGAGDLGINIPAAKQAEYDRYTACHRAYSAAAITPSGSQSDGTSVRGLGPNPSLKDCGPGDR